MAINLNLQKGIRLEQFKRESFVRPLLRLHPPESITVPLIGFDQSRMIPIPRVGELFAKYSMLARSQNGASWVVSPLSGRLLSVERINHPMLGSVLCAKINVRESIPPLEIYGHDPAAMSDVGIIQAARLACIFDEADGLPLFYKLDKAKKDGALLLIGDGIDDRPYISSSLKTIAEFGTDVNDGLGMAMKVIGGGLPVLAVYDPGELNMENVTGGFGFTDIMTVAGGYPAWYRFERDYCAGRKYLRIGVQALRALSLAVRRGEPQVESIITVCGDCVANPANVIVPSGVSVDYILQQIGLKKSPRYVILGDTMCGVTCEDLNIPVIPGIRGICAMSELPESEKHDGCVSCGRCTEVCPRRLFPSEAVRIYESGRRRDAAAFGAKDCTGCGACSAVCPAGLDVADIMLDLADI